MADEVVDLDLGFEPIELDETQQDTLVEDHQEEIPTDEAAADALEGEEQEPTDGRKLPDEVRKALKALRDSSPENAKAARALNDVYGREQAYKAIYPTVKDAQTAQTTIQTIASYGGLDAIQSTISSIEEIDQLLASGDPKAIDTIVEVAGEGFAKIAPAMLDRLQSSNPEAYAAAIRPHLVTAIGQSGLSEAFGAVIQAYNIANTPGATAEFKAKFDKDAADGLVKIHQYLQNLGKTPEKIPGSTQQPDKFSERETAIAAREAQAFNTEVGNLANTKMNVSLEKAIAPYIRQLKLSGNAKADFVQGVYDEVAKLVQADTNYQRQKDALFKSRTKDAGKIAQHMSSKFDEVVGQASKIIASRRYGKSAPVAGKQASSATTQGGTGKVVLVKELPQRAEVDWNKTTDDMLVRGVRVLKSGRTVKLDR